MPKTVLANVSNAWLEIDYRGDIGRLSEGATLLDDAFWDGRPLRIGLRQFAERFDRTWTFNVSPLWGGSPIYLDEAYRPKLARDEQLVALEGISLTPEYELRLTTDGAL